MDQKFNIERLNINNWAAWKIRISAFLKGKKLWRFVTGEQAGDGDAAAGEKEAAYAVIVMNVDSNLLHLISDTEDPAECWKRLRDHFERRTLANKLFLKKRYFRSKMQEGDKLNDHLKRMKELTDQLAAIGSKISDEDQIVTLLGSLPDSYSTIVTALESRVDSGDLTPDFVKQALTNEELKRLEPDRRQESKGTALSAKEKPKPNKKTAAAGGFKGRCYHCGQNGHMKRDCPQRPKMTSGTVNANSATSGARNTDEDSSTGGFDTYMLGVAERNQSENHKNCDWILDSGASRHMTYDSSRMTDYCAFNEPQDVRVGDGRVLKAVGVGKAAGVTNESCNVTLCNVLYVPDLAFNLVSVSALSARGCNIIFHGDRSVLKVNEKCIGVAKKGNDRLFHFRLDPNSESCNACGNSSTVGWLWHRRMAHLNRKALGMLPSMVDGMDAHKNDLEALPFCEDCTITKMHKLPFPQKSDT